MMNSLHNEHVARILTTWEIIMQHTGYCMGGRSGIQSQRIGKHQEFQGECWFQRSHIKNKINCKLAYFTTDGIIGHKFNQCPVLCEIFQIMKFDLKHPQILIELTFATRQFCRGNFIPDFHQLQFFLHFYAFFFSGLMRTAHVKCPLLCKPL